MKSIIFDNDRVGKWVEQHGGGFYRVGTQCVGLEKDGELVAGVLYDWFNGASIYMHVAASGKYWLTREFLRIVFDYPFNQLKCKTIIGLVAEDNRAARRFDEKIGFLLQSIIPQGHPSGGLFVYTMRKDQCKWL